MLSEGSRKPLRSYPSGSEDVENSSSSSQPVMELTSGRKPVPNADRAYKQGIWTLQELLILQAVRREDIVRRKEGFERQLKEGLAQKELKSRVERWQEIEEACWARGVYRSAEQCQSRWEYMSREWRRINHHETSCTRFGEPSYWIMTPGERTQKGLVSNFYYELYQALLEWVGKLTRNVPFHHCPGTSKAVHSAGFSGLGRVKTQRCNTLCWCKPESSTSDLPGSYSECHFNDSNVDTGGISSSEQTSTMEHNGAGHPCRSFGPQFLGPRPYQYPAYPSLAPCGPGAVFPPFPCPPWIHPTPYSMHPGFFQQPPVNLCGQTPVQVPLPSSACASPFLLSDCIPPCVCRAVGAGLSPTPSCSCSSCGAGHIPVTSGHVATCSGTCQQGAKIFSSATECTMPSPPTMSVHPTHHQPQSPQKASESVSAANFAQVHGDPLQPCHTGCSPTFKTEPAGSSFAGHHQCSGCTGCTSGAHFSPNFARTPPFVYGPPVYLPYPCPRCNLNPWGYSYHPHLCSSHSSCPSSGPPFWSTSEGKSQEYPLQEPHCAEGVAISDIGLGTDRQPAEFQDYPVRGIDTEGQEIEEPQYEDEPRFVLTEEWAEFFARSAAQRREKKRQQQREAKAARKAAKAGCSSQEIAGTEEEISSFEKTSPTDSQLYMDL